MYHAVSWDRSLISTSPEIFQQQMEWLHSQGCQAISLSQLVHQLDHAKNPRPKTVVLTFDDGFAGLFEHVFPILGRYNFSATVFLVSGYCGGLNNWPGQLADVPSMPLLDWDQIRAMDEGGIEFGAHTVSHPMLDQLEPDAIRKEIVESKQQIETHLDHEIDTFAYPYGRYNEFIKQIVKSEFHAACTTRVGLAGLHHDPFEIDRVDANYVSQLWLFKKLLSKSFPAYLNIRGFLRKLAGAALNRQYR